MEWKPQKPKKKSINISCQKLAVSQPTTKNKIKIQEIKMRMLLSFLQLCSYINFTS